MIRSLVLVVSIFSLLACSVGGNGDKSATSEAEGSSATLPQLAENPHPKLSPAIYTAAPTGSQAPSLQSGGKGMVKNVLQAGNYTYVELQSMGKSLWVALNHTEVKVGDKVAWHEGAIMRNFRSKILDRTFPEVMFIPGFIPLDQRATGGVKGVVISVRDAAGYSYLEVDTEQGKKWLALPASGVESGQHVRWYNGSVMRDFYSKSLDRKFEEIVFIASLETVE